MKTYLVLIGVALAVLIASCGPVKPTATPPTLAIAVLPSATWTATAVPISTSTPVPPTATVSPTLAPTPTATATATPKPTAAPAPTVSSETQDLPPIPAGMGGLVVKNFFSQELGLEIGGKFHKIPGFGQIVIFLPPGRYTFSATIPGYAGGSGVTEILEHYYVPQDFYGQ
jgi:hypothetical protein